MLRFDKRSHFPRVNGELSRFLFQICFLKIGDFYLVLKVPCPNHYGCMRHQSSSLSKVIIFKCGLDR